MTRKLCLFILRLFSITVGLLEESLRFARQLFRPKVSLIAENLFLRKQLAFYQERNVRPQRLCKSLAAALVTLVRLAECFGDRKAGNLDRVARTCIPAFLALEMPGARWKTSTPHG